MPIQEQILAAQLDNGTFENEDPMVSGIARRAIDNGWDNLSERQKAVLQPFLSQPCEGVTNPGGHHNECVHALEGEALVEAYRNQAYYDALLCQNCIDELEGYRREWERIQAE